VRGILCRWGPEVTWLRDSNETFGPRPPRNLSDGFKQDVDSGQRRPDEYDLKGREMTRPGGGADSCSGPDVPFTDRGDCVPRDELRPPARADDPGGGMAEFEISEDGDGPSTESTFSDSGSWIPESLSGDDIFDPRW